MSKIISVFAVLLCASSALYNSCNDPRVRGQQSPTIELKPTAGSGVSCQSNGVCINTAGWRLPDLEGVKASTTAIEELKSSSGDDVDVATVNYVLDNIFTDEPFSLIGADYGKLALSSVKEFSLNEKVFAYVVFAQRTRPNAVTHSYEGTGTIFFFAFVDRDGDGKFETLLRSLESNFTVPDWTLRNVH
ncbi:MAG: hypothetical protein LC113_07165 [Acidobacteria bacterium]|nr:hypothetical protein [Acidobacteriota bacterium]